MANELQLRITPEWPEYARMTDVPTTVNRYTTGPTPHELGTVWDDYGQNVRNEPVYNNDVQQVASRRVRRVPMRIKQGY